MGWSLLQRPASEVPPTDSPAPPVCTRHDPQVPIRNGVHRGRLVPALLSSAFWSGHSDVGELRSWTQDELATDSRINTAYAPFPYRAGVSGAGGTVLGDKATSQADSKNPGRAGQRGIPP